MSCGSRATQAKPEALTSCSEQCTKKPLFMRVTAGCVRLRRYVPGFHGEIYFSRARDPTAGRLRTGAQDGAESADCAGEQEHLAIDDKFEDDMHSLIEIGKEKGYLTYGDVNDMLPDEIGYFARRSGRPDHHHRHPGHRSARRPQISTATRISNWKRAKTSSWT